MRPTSVTTMRISLLAATTALSLVALAGCTDSPDPQGGETPDQPTSTTSSPQEPKEPAEPGDDSEAGDGTSTGGGATVPAYFAGDASGGVRLFREFRRVDGDPLLAAAELVSGGTPDDPDYRTLWPDVAIESVQPTDGVLLVTLADDGFTTRPDGMTADAARMAVQQMVYTLQGVAQVRSPVQFVRSRGPARLFDLDIEQPFTQRAPLDVLALVSVTSPEQGATVARGTLEVSGVASSFEANVPWEVRRGDEVVLDGFATAEGWMDKLYPWQASVDVSSLEPGDYTFAAMTDDPSGGEGSGPTEDTRDFTVE